MKKFFTLSKKAHQKAKDILTENISKLHELSEFLLEHETITGEEFMKVLEAAEKQYNN